MGWTPYVDAEAAMGTRLARKIASGAVPTYQDAGGQRWVWLQQEGVTGRDDVLWEVLAELRRVREALGRLEAEVQGREAAPRAGRVVPMSTGAWRRLEALLEPGAGDAQAA